MSARVDVTSAEPVCCPRCSAEYHLQRPDFTLAEIVRGVDPSRAVMTARCACPPEQHLTFDQVRAATVVPDVVVFAAALPDDRVYRALVVA